MPVITHRRCSDCSKATEVESLSEQRDGRLLCPDCSESAARLLEERRALEQAGQLRIPGMPREERIKEAALLDLQTGLVYTGKNHAACVHAPGAPMYEWAGIPRSLLFRRFGKQGFVTEEGRFVDRKEAAQIALACGQIDRLRYLHNELDSADLNYHSRPAPGAQAKQPSSPTE